ncbi:AAA family ATPase [Nocardiopsis synnemataformans]|uniref:AAA family ATPase n=1 Tax=Nocardiopsis synnemataformans TaxID=61305 RepID=UPI003EBD4781
MRIERLDLAAFGPFSEESLDLSRPGVHVIHGPNEAGKSSALAALRALLYGIPVQTPFDFVHAKRELRLGAVLSDGDDTLDVVRHKRRENTLTTPAGEPVPEGHLLGFLNGVSEHVFTTTFALTLAELKSGGQSLVRGEGDIGQALYSAQSSLDLAVVLEELRARREELYLPKGQKRPLNLASSQYNELTERIEQEATAADGFVRLRQQVEDAGKEFARLDALLGKARSQHEQWKDVRSALAPLHTRKQALREKAALEAEGPLASPEAEERMLSLQEEAASSRFQREEAERLLDSHREELGQLSVDARLTAARDAVAALTRSAEANAQTARSLQGFERDAQGLRADAAERLRRARPEAAVDAADALHVPVALETRITSLAKEHPALVTGVDHTRAQLETKTAEADRTRALLDGLPEADGHDVLATVVKNAPPRLVEEFTRARQNLAATTAELASLASEAGWDTENHAAVLDAAVPTRSEVSAYRTRVTAHAAETKSQRAEHAKTRTGLAKAREELAALRSLMDPPSVEDLHDARERRDALWTRIRREESAEDLFGEFESALDATDRLADRLRDHSDAIAQRLTLEKQVRGLEQDVQHRAQAVEELDRERSELDREWESLWPGEAVPAPPLDAAESVLERVDALRRLYRQQDEQQQDLEQWEQTARALIDSLLGMLTEAGAPVEALASQAVDSGQITLLVPALLDLADTELQRRAQAAEQRSEAQLRARAADADLEQASLAAATAETALADWTQRWEEAVVPAGFAPGTAPEEVQAELDLLREANDLLRRAEEAERDAEQAHREVDEFDERLAAAFALCAQELPDSPGERARALEELDQRVTANARDHERAEKLRESIASAGSALGTAQAAERKVAEDLAALWKEYGVTDSAGLRAAVDRATKVAEQRKRIVEAEEHLARLGDLTALEQQAEGLGDAEVRERLEQAGRHRDEVSGQRDAANTALADANSAFARVDGTARAARLAEERAELVARAAEQTEEYVRLTLAEQILLSRVEAYRQQNQDPILRRAEELFAFLTLGRFTGLRPDLDDKGNNVLWVVRRNGREEKVSALSEGTADQLYLALRLASLERYAEAGQTMPFVVDDVFMTFDDERSEAALKVLDGMADRFQVVVFTHHDHLARLAEWVLPDGRAHLHPLPRFNPPQHNIIAPGDGTAEATTGKASRSGVAPAASPGERTCRDCGNTFIHTKRGRPPVLCPQCRG